MLHSLGVTGRWLRNGLSIFLPRVSIRKIRSAPTTSPVISRTTRICPLRPSRRWAAYAQLAAELSHQEDSTQYEAAAKSMALKWASMAAEDDHYRLAFDKPGT